MINKLTTDLNIIQGLDDEPNDVTGLTAAQLKAKFDEAPNNIKDYINALVDTLNSIIAGQSGAENIGSAPIAGIDGATVYDQIKNMLAVAQAAQAGTILPGVVTDAMLSDAADQIKARFASSLADYATDTGVVNAYKITLTPAPTSYEIGKIYKFKAINANTGVSTFQIGALAATSIKKNLTDDLTNGDILNGQIVSLIYDGTNFQLIGVTQSKIDKTDYIRAGGYAVTAGTSTAYTITLSPAPTAYADGQQYMINPHVDCGVTPTLNVNGLGADTILKQDGSAVSAGDIKANIPLALVRVGSNFFIRSSGGSNIKSLQRGVATIAASTYSKAVTISNVDVTKAVIRIKVMVGGGTYLNTLAINATITNSTTITFMVASTTGQAHTIYWEVIEFNNVKSLQNGVKTITGTSDNITVSNVNTLKSMLFYSFTSSSATMTDVQYSLNTALVISTATNIAISQNQNITKSIIWYLIEFN